MEYDQARRNRHFMAVRKKFLQELANRDGGSTDDFELNEKIMLWDTIHGLDWWHGHYGDYVDKRGQRQN